MKEGGFTKDEAEFFGHIVRMQIQDAAMREIKPKREKKPPKMKRGELLLRLLVWIERSLAQHLQQQTIDTAWIAEGRLLEGELERIVK